MLQKIVFFIANNRVYIALAALIVISFSLMSYGDLSKMGGFRALSIGVIGTAQDVFDWTPSPAALRRENRALRELNLQLSLEATRGRLASKENERLRKMLEMKAKSEYPLISSEIVGRTSVQMRNYAIINLGTKRGVKKGMSVRTDAGLVGIIMGATDSYSLAQFISNRDVKVTAKIERGGQNGMLVWKEENKFELKNINRATDVQVGDNVLTSSISSRYPADVPIGRVVEVGEEQGSLFKKIIVEAYVDFSSVEQTFIIDFIADAEREKLVEKMQEEIQVKSQKKR